MKKISKVVNIVAMSISLISFVLVAILIVVNIAPIKNEAKESRIIIENVVITKRESDGLVSYFGSGVKENAMYYLVVAFELFELEQNAIHLVINEEDVAYIIVIDDKQEAFLVYSSALNDKVNSVI